MCMHACVCMRMAAAAKQEAKAVRDEVASLGAALRQSVFSCTCVWQTHTERCDIHGSRQEIRWWGYEFGTSKERVQWYYDNGGKVRKGFAF